MRNLTDKLSLDLVADIQWFGDNDDPFGGDRLERDNMYQAQAMLSYDFSPATAAHVRYSWKGGAESTLDGISGNDKVDTATVTVGVTHWLVPGKVQLIAQYVNDTRVQDFGFEAETSQLRLLYLSGL